MKIKSLLIIPGKEVQVVKIPASLKFIRAFIGKDLFQIKLSDKTSILANRNANIEEFNRILQGKIILGTFLIVSFKNNHITSMPKKSIRQYSNMFKLRKHKKKIDYEKEKLLEDYYSKRNTMKQKAVTTKQKIIAA